MKSYFRAVAALAAVSVIALAAACGGGKDAAQPATGGVTQQPASAAKLASDAQKTLESGKVDEAVAQFSTAVAEGANSAAAFSGLAAGLIQQGKYEEAIEDLGRAIVQEPKNDAFFESRAIAETELFKKNGDKSLLVRAILDADASFKLKPDRIGPLFARGEAYFLNGDYDKALADMQECVKRSKGFQRAWIVKGKTEAAMGKTADAKASFQQVVQLDPNGQNGEQAKAELAKLP